ncbi:MAG TPA: DUF5606 domain-containing protein [Flavobacterium sp.]|nr:DUF5606 domain-containing protein [Flavobacterium sp.]
MSLDKILAISGKPGLYELKVQTRSGFLAESLLDGKKLNVGLQSNVSLLSEISVYTYEGEKPLAEILKAIAEKEDNKQTTANKEDKATLEQYFSAVVPDYDADRVYASDMKKIVNWYNLLVSKELVSKDMEIKKRAEAEDSQDTQE